MHVEDRGLFWYIDSQSKPKIVQIGKRNLTNIDPLQCIVGVWVLDDKNLDDARTSNTIRTYQQSEVQYPTPKVEPKNIYTSSAVKTRLNRSEHIDKNYELSFKPETPMKISFNEDKFLLTNRPRV